MPRMTLLLTVAALIPVPFLALGPILGGWFAGIALFYLSIFAFLIDETVRIPADSQPLPGAGNRLAINAVPMALALAHFGLLPLAVWALTQDFGLGLGAKLTSFWAFAIFFGTISTANAHELIHRSNKLQRRLGTWMFISMLFGHHASAHPGIHHQHVATPLDPNTARLNESFYRFFRRAWHGSFQAGRALEAKRLRLRGLAPLHPANPYVGYLLGALAMLVLAAGLGGISGVLIYISLALFAQLQLMLADYVQHYGLERQRDAQGKYRRVEVRHAWNAPHIFSSALMLNAPRHSDHHLHPAQDFTRLSLLSDQGAPMLPHSIAVMSIIALWPRAWKRLMNPRVRDWQQVQSAKTPTPPRNITAGSP